LPCLVNCLVLSCIVLLSSEHRVLRGLVSTYLCLILVLFVVSIPRLALGLYLLRPLFEMPVFLSCSDH
jgi:hypothetical protein